MVDDMSLVKRLREGQTFHCPECGHGFPVQDPTSADALEAKDAEIARLKSHYDLLLGNQCDIETKLREENTRLQAIADARKADCVDFFRWWYNQPGTNTDQGYDEWIAAHKEGSG